MNRIYKSIWNAITHSWTAVSEWQKSKGKSSRSKAVTSIFFLTLYSSAYAINLTDTVGIGIGSSVQYADHVTYTQFSDKEYQLNDSGASLDLNFGNKDNSAQLFSQSQGIEFQLYSIGGDLRKGPGADSNRFTVTNISSETGTTYRQTIRQNGNDVASATYIIGQEARDFFVNVFGYQTDEQGRITVDEEQYSSTGINHNSYTSLVAWEHSPDDPDKGVWTLAVLRNLEIKDKQTLSLNADKSYNWYANLSGSGNIEYTSVNPNITVDIDSLVSSDENIYTGATTVNGVTVNLLRNKSLGNTNLLSIINGGTVNVKTDTESVGELQVNNGILDISGKTFTVGTGGVEVGEAGAVKVDDSTLQSDGSISVKGELSGSKAKIQTTSGHPADIEVFSYNDLLQNATFSAESVGDIIVHDTLALGHMPTVYVGNGRLVFNGADGADRNEVPFDAVKVEALGVTIQNGSNVIYDKKSDFDLRVSDRNGAPTLISGGSTLTISKLAQLGGNITFSDSADTSVIEDPDKYSRLVVALSNETVYSGNNSWSFKNEGKFVSEGTGAVVVAQGPLPTFEFNLNDAQWENYNGWLRIENSAFTLDKEKAVKYFDRMGLSVGSESNVSVTESGLKIDRFGWSQTSETKSSVLDLSHLDSQTIDDDTPALTVGTLWIQGGGSISLDPTLWLKDVSTDSGKSILDYQDGDVKRYIVQVTGEIKGDGRIQLDYAGTSETTQIFNQNNLTNLAANLHWRYLADSDQGGVYLTYGVDEIELKGGEDPNSSLLVQLDKADSNYLNAKLTGEGIVEVSTQDQNKKVLKINNYENNFTGLIQFGENLGISALEGALGKGNAAISLSNGTKLTLLDSISSSPQTINGLDLGENSQIVLSEGTTLVLDLKTDNYLTKDSVEVGNSQLLGDGNLEIKQGQITFKNSADTFSDQQFTGDLTVNGTAVFDGTDDDQFVLTGIDGIGSIVLNVNTSIGNIKGFNGKLSADTSTVEFNNSTVLAEQGLQLSGDQTSVVFNDYDAVDQLIDFEGTYKQFLFKETKGTLKYGDSSNLILTDNSSITRQVNQLDLSAQIDETSSIYYELSDQQHTVNLDLSQFEGKGLLSVAFENPTEISIDQGTTVGMEGTFRYENAQLEIGAKHAGNNHALIVGNKLQVGTNSKLILNGSATLSHDLILEQDSTIDFTRGDDFVTSGNSTNMLDMGGKNIVLTSDGTKIITAEVDTSLQVKPADLSGTLLDAIKNKPEDEGLTLTLIDNIGKNTDLGKVVGALELEGTGSGNQTVVTYYDENNREVADITTGVGLDYYDNSIGLSYNGVTEVAIYQDQTAELIASNAEKVEINATIKDKVENGNGSLHFGGDGTIVLNNTRNSYTGHTNIDSGVTVVANNDGVLGKTQGVHIDNARLEINGNQSIGELTMSSEGTLSISEGHVVQISSSQGSYIQGNLEGSGWIYLLDSSQLTYATDGDKKISVGIATAPDSTLIKDGVGSLEFDKNLNQLNLTVANGNVVLKQGDNLGTLSFGSTLSRTGGSSVDITGLVTISNLTGNSGIFNMNVDLGSGSQLEFVDGKPGLLIENGTGNHVLNVTSGTNKGAEEKIKLVEVQNGDANFTLLQGGITSGGYDYTLQKESSSTGGNNFFLSSIVDGGSDSDDHENAIRNTTVTAGSYIGIAYAAQLFDLSLHDRVGSRDWINPVTGEKQTTSLWMHHTMSHERFRDSTSQLRMRTTSNTTMLGGDFVQFTTGNTGLAYAGLMGGYGTMDTKSHSKMTNLHSKAETDAWGVGAYAGWKADSDGQTGPYVDGWLMFTHASSDVTGVDRNTEDVKGEGLSASIEAGWGFKVGSAVMDNGKVANLTVEPHASVTWFGMQYDEIHNDAQDVKFEGTNNVRTRLGARAIVTEEGNKDFNAFVEANWVHNTQEYGATISGLRVDQAGSRNLGEARIGLDWHVTDSLSVWGRVGASYGSDAYSEREGSIGVRYQF